jgi:type IV secretion system protein VirD4
MKDNTKKRPKRTRRNRINLNTWLLYMIVFINQLLSLFSRDNKLHNARFAKLSEMLALYGAAEDHEACLLLGIGHMNHMIRVRPKAARPELGNLLVVAPTRGGKGLLAVSQLLSWRHSVVVNDIKGDLFTQTAGYRSTLGPVFVVDPTGTGHRYDPLSGKQTEDDLLSNATQLLHKSDEGDGAIFTQRATVMLTQMFLAARHEQTSPLLYVRTLIRDGLVATTARLDSIDPELSTQFLNVDYEHANLSDRFLTSAWGTLDTRMRPLLTETVIRSLSGADFTAGELMCGERPIMSIFAGRSGTFRPRTLSPPSLGIAH